MYPSTTDPWQSPQERQEAINKVFETYGVKRKMPGKFRQEQENTDRNMADIDRIKANNDIIIAATTERNKLKEMIIRRQQENIGKIVAKNDKIVRRQQENTKTIMSKNLEITRQQQEIADRIMAAQTKRNKPISGQQQELNRGGSAAITRRNYRKTENIRTSLAALNKDTLKAFLQQRANNRRIWENIKSDFYKLLGKHQENSMISIGTTKPQSPTGRNRPENILEDDFLTRMTRKGAESGDPGALLPLVIFQHGNTFLLLALVSLLCAVKEVMSLYQQVCSMRSKRDMFKVTFGGKTNDEKSRDGKKNDGKKNDGKKNDGKKNDGKTDDGVTHEENICDQKINNDEINDNQVNDEDVKDKDIKDEKINAEAPGINGGKINSGTLNDEQVNASTYTDVPAEFLEEWELIIPEDESGLFRTFEYL